MDREIWLMTPWKLCCRLLLYGLNKIGVVTTPVISAYFSERRPENGRCRKHGEWNVDNSNGI